MCEVGASFQKLTSASGSVEEHGLRQAPHASLDDAKALKKGGFYESW